MSDHYRDTPARNTNNRHQRPRRRKLSRRVRNRVIFRVSLMLLALILVITGIVRLVDHFQRSTDIRLTDEGYNHADRFSGATVLNGIDISVYQGNNIKWKKVKTSGVDFVFIRAGYRNADSGVISADENFEANIKGANKAGIMAGAYFYSQALTPQEAEEEAVYLLEKVKPYEITMPLVIDFEIYPGGRLDKKIQAGDMYAASFYHDIVEAFCRKVEESGYESAVYANKDMLTHYMQADLIDDTCSIWLAQFGDTSNLEADYQLWQCSDSAVAGGIEGNVDHDFWYVVPNKVYKTRGAGIKEGHRISIGECHVSFQRSVIKLKRGRAIPRLGITYDGRVLREGKDYSLSFVRNTEPGTGYIIIRGMGLYKNWMMIPYAVE